MLAIRLLGQFNLRFEGRALALASRPAQALLAYLLLYPTPHRREKLAGLLWPDTTDGNARRNLRQALWQLRRALEGGEAGAPDYILADEISIAFASEASYSLDVSRLEGALDERCSTEELVAAVSAYGGELLPGFYDDWVVLERERLQGVFDRAALALLKRLMGDERWSDTVDWAQRWIATGHVPEPAFRALMIAHSQLNDGASAAAAFRRCQQALRDELGVEPSAETLRLYELLQAGRRLPVRATTERSVTAGPRGIDMEAVDAAPAPGDPPYKGMPFFDEEDAALFFGREEVTARLIARLQAYPAAMAVVGASGSGKSSVLRAGLVPAVRAAQSAGGGAEWLVRVITPTAQPLASLAASLTTADQPVRATAALMDDLARDARSFYLAARRLLAGPGQAGPARLLLVVDQFEELFTLCRSETERRAFIENLLTAAWPTAAETPDAKQTPAAGDGRQPNRLAPQPVALVIALRADFYPHCSHYPGLRVLLSQKQEYIGPMNASELRRAIEAPAARCGWSFEPGLVDLMLHDAGDEPGALPLLSHALLETWRRRRGRTLTLPGYAEAGGVRGAIAKSAEHLYRSLTPEEQTATRAIFLRLAVMGDGNRDTRRRVALSELVPVAGALLQTLADARLITLGAGTVEVAHEALLAEWPALAGWLAEDREGRRVHRHLTEAAAAWEALGRDPAELYRGARLAQAAEWAAGHPAWLNALEDAFLAASKAQAEGEVLARDAQRQRELAAAQMLAATQERAARGLRRRALWLSGALALAAVLAVVAILAGRQAILSARSAEAEARIARAREWAAAARDSLDSDPERSILLSLQAVTETYQANRTVLPEAQDALHRAVALSHVHLTLTGHTGAVTDVAYSPDGGHVVTAGEDGQIRLWDAASGRLLRSFTAHPFSAALAVAFNPDGQQVITVSRVEGVKVWDMATGQQALAFGLDPASQNFPSTNSVAFSPDGRLVATGHDDGAVRLWDAQTGAPRLTLAAEAGAEQLGVAGLAFSPDGRWLAVARPRAGPNAGEVYEVATGRRVLALPGADAGLNAIAFSPDGRRLAGADRDHTAKIWNAATGAALGTLTGHTGELTGVAFSPEGARLATASLDGTARVWDVAAGQAILTLTGHAGAIDALAFDPTGGGTRLVTGGVDGTARVWDITPGREVYDLLPTQAGDAVSSIAFASAPGDGPAALRFAAASRSGALSLWQLGPWSAASAAVSNALLRQTDLAGGPGAGQGAGSAEAPNGKSNSAPARAVSLALSPDGRRLVTSGAAGDASVIVSDAATGQLLLKLADAGEPVQALALSGDGSRLLTAGADREARLWDLTTGQQLQVLAGLSSDITAVAANADGSRLVTAGQDGQVILWDATSGLPIYTLDAASLGTTPGLPAGPEHGQPALGGRAGLWAVAFSPDGRLLAVGGQDDRVSVWEVANHQQLFTLAGHTAEVRSIAFSPDGVLLATGSGDTTARVWDLRTHLTLYTLTGHSDAVTEVAFSPDGALLATASADGTVRFYLAHIEDLVALARARVTRSLTAGECQQYLHLEECPAS